MAKKDLLTKILVITGALLVSFTVLTPVMLAIISLASRHGFRFDYLMPAELFPVALVGWLLLLWGSYRARSHKKWIAYSFFIAVVALLGGQTLALVTGLANGEPGGEDWLPLVLGTIVVYDLALVVLGFGGWYLFSYLIRKSN